MEDIITVKVVIPRWRGTVDTNTPSDSTIISSFDMSVKNQTLAIVASIDEANVNNEVLAFVVDDSILTVEGQTLIKKE